MWAWIRLPHSHGWKIYSASIDNHANFAMALKKSNNTTHLYPSDFDSSTRIETKKRNHQSTVKFWAGRGLTLTVKLYLRRGLPYRWSFCPVTLLEDSGRLVCASIDAHSASSTAVTCDDEVSDMKRLRLTTRLRSTYLFGYQSAKRLRFLRYSYHTAQEKPQEKRDPSACALHVARERINDNVYGND